MNFVMVEDDFLSQKECTSLIKKYKSKTNKETLKQHVSYCDYDITGEEDLHLKASKLIQKYRNKYPSINNTVDQWGMRKFKFKHFPPGYAFSGWHCEHDLKYPDRILCMQVYLSDHNCGTEFFDPNVTVMSKTGRAVIFPAFWTHLHRGQLCPEKKDRYLLANYGFLLPKN